MGLGAKSEYITFLAGTGAIALTFLGCPTASNSPEYLTEPFKELHFAMHRRKTSKIPVTNIAGVGGQPGIYPSTGMTTSTAPTMA